MSDHSKALDGVSSFGAFEFDPRIQAGIEAAGFDTPTPIQQQAIPFVLQGRDVLGLAQTGTGKTAAFMLPILQRLTRGPLRRPRVLIIAPTRELAEQIQWEAEQHIPFDIKRVYYLYDVPAGATRAGHAHLALQQLLIPLSGSFDVRLHDG